MDAGLKSLSTDSGFSVPKSLPGVSYRPAGDEHGILSWEATAGHVLEVGDRGALAQPHRHHHQPDDAYHAQRAGVIEALWPVLARGKVQ